MASPHSLLGVRSLPNIPRSSAKISALRLCSSRSSGQMVTLNRKRASSMVQPRRHFQQGTGLLRHPVSPGVATGTQAVLAAAATAEKVSSFEELAAGTQRKYIMISGKGGVGKTSLSASLAVRLAAAGHTTLVVSTDPAHSLGDSLAQDIGGGKPVLVAGSDLPLWAMEIDTEEAKREFKIYSQENNTGGQAMEFMKGMGLGMIADQLADLKLGELLDTPPPGLDEAVAIAKVNDFVQKEEYAKFSRIVFDTAPTGHTLRLLGLPDFVEASLGKIIRLRKKLNNATGAIRSLFGASGEQDSVVAKLEDLQKSIATVKALFRDASTTEFIIATIPTVLGINESARLLKALRKDSIPCKRLIVNQVIGPNQGDTFLKLKLKDQERSLAILRDDPDLVALRHINAPLVDLEVRGVPALQYFGSLIWKEVFEQYAAGSARKYFMLGGKGGVGKTSSAASLAARFAMEGHPTLIVSTDPAHSLSDALDQDVSGGLPVQVVGGGADELPLWGMEIELEQARQELRELTANDDGKKFNDFLDGLGLGMITDQLKELNLGELLDSPPPGVDEAVAISKVVQFLKNPQYSKFTRIVFDTAPTGHTLRLLSLPDFLDVSIGKLVRLRQKLSFATNKVKSMFTGKEEKDPAVEKLEELKARMEEAKNLFRDASTTEFIIVTIPTIMAASESARLAKALRAEKVPCNTIVVNQVLQDGATEKFLANRRADQQRAMQRIAEDPGLKQLQVIQGPLFDLEVRGVPALQYFGSIVWK